MTKTTGRIRRVAGVAGCLLLVAATMMSSCGGRDDGGSGTADSARDTTVAAPDSLVAPPDSTSPAIGPDGEWRVGFDNVGPVLVGMTVPEVQQLIGGTVRVDRIEAGQACGFAVFSAAPTGVSFMLQQDTIVRINVTDGNVRTVNGVGIGDAEADIVARLRPRVMPHKYTGPVGHYVVLDAPGGAPYRMLFETDGTVVLRYRSGQRDKVDLVEGCL